MIKDKIPATDWAFLRFCQKYWSSHSFSWTYTMKWYWYAKWWIKTDNYDSLPSIKVNWIRINSDWYATSYFRLTEWFVTLSPWDTIEWWASWVDYY